MKQLALLLLVVLSLPAVAQKASMQYFRPNNKLGINIFEPSKNDTTTFRKLKVKIGGNFAQDFQAIRHENNATPVVDANNVNINQLANLGNGFNLAMANLNLDAQLEDGIRMNLTLYLSSRHHAETWVKGGFIQMDKLPFLKSAHIDNAMKHLTLKMGAYEVDYGDQHFRRSDGGNTFYNSFMENYIMDEFATEIGGEVYFHPQNGFIAMAGITNGALNPTVIASTATDSATGKVGKYTPALHGKLGYDKQFSSDFRFRITGSGYLHQSAANNTLFGGDRTGSHYFYTMENRLATAAGNAFSGRFNPAFKKQVAAVMINPFVKFKGIELFGTYEIARGRTITEKKMRSATQYAVDLIYRFPAERENFWVGARYNSVTATMPNTLDAITIDRLAGSAGWFITHNILLKAEYVRQTYQNFVPTDIRSGGKFSGVMLEAAVGF